MVSCATLRLRVGAKRAGGRMEDECVGSGGDRAVSGRLQQRQGGLAWPAVTGQVHSGGGRGHQALGWQGEKTPSLWKGKSVFQRILISPVLLWSTGRGVVYGAGARSAVEFLLRHATLD